MAALETHAKPRGGCEWPCCQQRCGLVNQRIYGVSHRLCTCFSSNLRPDNKVAETAEPVDGRGDNGQCCRSCQITTVVTARTGPCAATSAWSRRCRSTHRDRGRPRRHSPVQACRSMTDQLEELA